MREELFREGGPHKIRRTGKDNYTLRITLPTDADGRFARECPSDACSPAYFKVKSGSGITGKQTVVFCPYCHGEAEPDEYTTESQIRYAKDIAIREAHAGANRMIKDALGIGSSGSRRLADGLLKIDLSLKEGRLPTVHRPFEEALQRVVVCPHCGLDHAVFGLAVWCSDCGKDIFLTHVAAELAVVTTMLNDVERRRTELGPRVAARDIENCLEDVVSIYEAVFRALFTRCLRERGMPADELQATLTKKIGNRFQNVRLSGEIIERELSVNLFPNSPDESIEKLIHTFEKRHPITHNLGIVDRKYLGRIRSAEREGRDVLLSQQEITEAITIVLKIVSDLHGKLFGAPSEPTT